MVMNRRRRASKGFSLIEVLIGLILLAIGLLAIGSLQITSLKGTTFSYHLVQATYLAQDRLEFIKSLPFDDSLLNAGQYPESGLNAAGIAFVRDVTVVYEYNDYGRLLKKIDCTVSWNDGRDHSVTVSTTRSQ